VINLRFHIVSITAAFLALAIGIFMGSTLLDRSTLDLLETRQKSLEEKIAQRIKENNAFRQALDGTDTAGTSYRDSLQRPLTAGTVSDRVVFVAGRGIDEGSLQRSIDDVTAAGGTYGGTVWLDASSLLTDASLRSTVAAALRVPLTTGADELAKLAREAVVASLTVPPVNGTGQLDGTTATSTSTPADPAAPAPPNDSGTVPPTTTASATLDALRASGFLELELPEGVTSVSPGSTQPRIVVVSGEGVAPKVEQLLAGMATSLVTAAPGRVAVAELLEERSSTGLIERNLNGQPPKRGRFVNRIRSADNPVAVATIDDLDRWQGRLSLVLVLAARPGTAEGAYGEADTAQAPFPPAPPGS